MAGAFFGVAVKPVLNSFLELPDPVAYFTFGFAGVMVASLVSIFLDVFSGRLEEADASTSD